MSAMFEIIAFTIRSMLSRKLIGLSITCILITAICLAASIYGVKIALDNTRITSWQWLEGILDFLGNWFAIVIAWFLFPVLMPIMASLFTDKVAKTVTAEDYPNQLQTISPSLIGNLIGAIRLSIKMLLLNILCLPLYLIPGLNLIIYYTLNAKFLGREFFEMVSNNYYEPAFTRRICKNNKGIIMLAGLFIVAITNLPVINLFAPIIGAVLMVHLFFYLYKNNKHQLVIDQPTNGVEN